MLTKGGYEQSRARALCQDGEPLQGSSSSRGAGGLGRQPPGAHAAEHSAMLKPWLPSLHKGNKVHQKVPTQQSSSIRRSMSPG